MTKILPTLFLSILICACSTGKIDTKTIRYFDENNLEISEAAFEKLRCTAEFIDIVGDSSHHKKLTFREKRGRVNDIKLLQSLIERNLNIALDDNKPLVIIYYPGKDRCNSGSSTDRQWLKNWHNGLAEGLQQQAQVQPIYIYKTNDEGLKKYKDIVTWNKDPQATIERLFFEHHYHCGSFVVVAKDGEYLSYFGEYAPESVWKATQLMNY